MARRSNLARSPSDDTNSQSLRGRIVAKALELLLRDGGVDELAVATALSISRKSFRVVFSSSEALEHAVLELALQRLFAQIENRYTWESLFRTHVEATTIPNRDSDDGAFDDLVTGVRYLNRERHLAKACYDILSTTFAGAPLYLARNEPMTAVIGLWLDVPASIVSVADSNFSMGAWVWSLYRSYVAADSLRVPLRIFLKDERGCERVQFAALLLARALDAELDHEAAPELSSWFARWHLWARVPSNADLVEEVSHKIARSLEIRALDVPQANVDVTLADAVKSLMESISSQESATVQVGSILIVKYRDTVGESRLVVRSLSPMQVARIERTPTMLKDPQSILDRLEVLADNVTPITGRTAGPPIATPRRSAGGDTDLTDQIKKSR